MKRKMEHLRPDNLQGNVVQGVGIGLRPKHYQNLFDSPSKLVPWVEVISENYMFTEGRPLFVLEKVRQDYPVALHGVSMSIGSFRNNRETYLDALSRLIERIDPWIVSDHFCWTGLGNHNSFDLLPLPFNEQSIGTIVENIDRVQNKIKRRIYLENVSAYIGFRHSQISEVEFINEILWQSGCGLLLDINNVYVNAHNFGLDAQGYIDRIDPSSIGEIHLAGHSVVDDFLFDTHDGPVCDEVWDLYRYALQRFGNIPTLIEWDESIPELERLLRERQLAENLMMGGKYAVARHAIDYSRPHHQW